VPDCSINDHLIAVTRILPHRLDDAFEDMTDDDAFLDFWFVVRKIKGRHKPYIKNEKGQDENYKLSLLKSASSGFQPLEG